MDDVCRELVSRGSDSPQWSIVAAAPGTSQVIGVVAAIVFAGVIFLLQQAPPSEDSDNYRYSSRALMVLLYSFISLTVASFLFSIIGGEELCTRAFSEGAAAGALFGTSVVGMVLSICWLFAAHRVGGPHVIWVKILLLAAAFVAWISVILTVFDASKAIETSQQTVARSGVIWWGAAPLLLPLSTLAVICWTPSLRRTLEHHAARMFEISLGFSIFLLVLAVGFFATETSRSEVHSFPLVFRFGITGSVALSFSLHFANMMIIRRAEDGADGP